MKEDPVFGARVVQARVQDYLSGKDDAAAERVSRMVRISGYHNLSDITQAIAIARPSAHIVK